MKKTTVRMNVSQQGWREIGGVRKYYRSKAEANYARYLEWLKQNNQIIDWKHEPHEFWFEQIKRGVRSYKPDFLVTENDNAKVWHEVKGWLDPKSITKLNRMRIYYPQEKIVVIRQKDVTNIRRKIVIEGWE